MFYPSVPDMPGVPGLPRIPPSVISFVGDSLDQATDIMAAVGVAGRNSPFSAMSAFLPDVTDASALIDSVQTNLLQYPSTLFNPFRGPVSDISSSLSSITGAINLNPTGPVSNILDSVDDSVDQIGNVADEFSADADVNDVTADGVESVTVTAVAGQPQWGIFEAGQAVVEADNVVGFEYKKDWTISDYPVEDGAFETYDKVELPYDARVRYSCGGDLDTRTNFLKSIEDIAGNLKLYDAVTPTKTYQSCNIVHVDYRQTAQNGVGLMVVDVYLEEVRVTAEAAFSQAAADPSSNAPPAPTKTPAPKSPSAQPQKNGGTKQAQPVPPGSAINSALAAVVPGL